MRQEILNHARIVVVDDETDQVALLCRILRQEGFQSIEGFTDPTEFMAKLPTLKPDLILVDLLMPKMDGLELIQHIRVQTPETDYLPVLAVTGRQSDNCKHCALATGAHDFLFKPIDWKELSLRVNNLLETRFLHRRLQEKGARLQVSEASLADAQARAHMGSWELDVASGVTTWSAEMYRLYERDPALGPLSYERFLEIVHPDDFEAFTRSYAEAVKVRSGRPSGCISLEFRTVFSNGSARWFETQSQPSFDANGNVVRLAGTVQDITERKHAQEALALREARIRAMLDSSLDAIVAMDDEGKVVEFNPAAEQLFGFARDEIIGRDLADAIVPPALRHRHREGIARCLAAGAEPLRGQRIEFTAMGKGGAEFPVELTISFVQQNGRAMFTSYIRDISERKRGEVALTQAKEEAERANRAKSEFLSRMSHELRTPLNAVLGFAQILESELQEPEHVESVQQVLKAGRHLLRLIDEVLDISRIDVGELSLSVEPVHVGEAMQAAVALVRTLAGKRKISIETDVADLHVMADRQRLLQVLLNFFSNAIKYSQSDGTVSLTCTAIGEGAIRISVHDTGEGIHPSEIDKLFVPFERLHAANTKIEGVGLGLSICKRLVDLMGGTIGVESELGRGSTFWVELPLVQSPVDMVLRTASSGVGELGSPGRVCTVLYIEDNLVNLKLVQRIIGLRLEFRLLAAMQGARGLELAREHVPDLILLDRHLPDLQGDEVLRRLKLDPETRDIPVIMLSADATSGKIERFIAAGARAYLTKPLDVRQFLEAVLSAVGTTPPTTYPPKKEPWN